MDEAVARKFVALPACGLPVRVFRIGSGGGQMHGLQRNGKVAGLLENTAEVAGVLSEVCDKFHEGRVDEGMTDLLPVLQDARLHTDEQEWSRVVQLCLDHPMRQLLHQDPFTYRAFSKPRGYAGDAVLLD